MEHVSATASTLSPNVRDAAREALPTMVGAGRIHWHDEARRAHASDETEDLAFMPDVVMEPESTAEVSSILAWANTHGVPVTAAGARTGGGQQYPNLQAFAQKIHALPSYQRALERGGPYELMA